MEILVEKGGAFPTLAAAQEEARKHPGSVVTVRGGEWKECLRFDERDSGTVWRGEDGAALTGGVTVRASSLTAPPPELRERLHGEAHEKVRVFDLSSLGLTPDDWGEVYAIGASQTSARYDGVKQGVNLEVFSGGRRMRLARYPDEGYLKLDGILDMGEPNEFPPQNYWRCNNGLRNPRAGTYIVDRATAERMKGWRDPSTAWMFGYFFWDWADSSTPIAIRPENRAVMPRFVSNYGARAGALYYLYNVPEELDAPGEFYLDRKTGLLAVWTYGADDDVEVSLADRPLLSGENVKDLTVEGFTLTAVRADAVRLQGEGVVLRDLLIRNVAGSAGSLEGKDNLITGCEVTRTGKGGFTLSGGDRATLTHGGNRIENCWIHDFSEVYQTYQAGICLTGVGNTAAHNEISGSPHMAMLYSGNEHLIEYNDIHDVVTHSSDAGAIYAGYDWCAHGTVIRWNRLRNIGGGDFRPDGIYWDDGYSGQTAYGNLLIDVRKNAFLVGGGFDNVVRGNVIIGESDRPLCYDDRDRDGFLHEGWARQAVNRPDTRHWMRLQELPIHDEPWRSRYPTLDRLLPFDGDPEDPRFPCNPTGAVMEGNVLINRDARFGWVADSVRQYGRVENNPAFHSEEEAGWDEATGEVKNVPDFPRIPVELIGREKK